MGDILVKPPQLRGIAADLAAGPNVSKTPVSELTRRWPL